MIKEFLIKFTKIFNLAVCAGPEKIISLPPLIFLVLLRIIEVGKSLLSIFLERRCKTMLAKAFVDNAKVMAKGQVTIPKDVRDVLGVASGDRVTFVVEGNTVRIVNSAVYAMQMLQQEMAGEVECTGLTSEDDVIAIVKELRNEDEKA